MVILRPAAKADRSPTSATWPLLSFVQGCNLAFRERAAFAKHLWGLICGWSDSGCGLLVPNSCAQWGDGWTVAVLWLLVGEHPLRSQLTGSSDQTPRGIWAPPSMFVSLLGRSLHKSVKENNLVVFDLRKVWRKLIKIQLILRFCYKFVSSAHDVIWETECNAEYPWKKKN